MITDKLEANSPETKAEATTAIKTSWVVAGVIGMGFWWLCGWHILGFVGGCLICVIGWIAMMAAQAPVIAKNDKARREQAMLVELKRANNLAEEADRIVQCNVTSHN